MLFGAKPFYVTVPTVERGKLMRTPGHNNGLDRSAQSEFLNILPVPLVRPLMRDVKWLAGTQDEAMKKRIVEVADEVGATSVICERFAARDRGKGDSARPVP